MKKNLFIFLFLAPLLAVALTGARIYYDIHIWSYEGPDVEFIIEKGEAFSKVNAHLIEQKLIKNAKIFHRYCQWENLLTSFKPGYYLIEKNSKMLDIINLFISGKSISIKVTIPEGKNIYEIGKILEENHITHYNEFILAAKNPEILKSFNIKGNSVEGHLYPDTYYFNKGISPSEIIKSMIHIFNTKIREVDLSEAPFDLRSVIILASIVEKETGVGSERPIIAGVFLNRLKKRMRLQSDPTTIYGIYETFNGNLKKDHLLEKTPYNTYKISGLPIGPIANPGIESIKAVLFPLKHDFLYFVSKNDGTHSFTRTYKDHLKEVEKWQLTRKNREGKSWKDLKKN